MADTQFITTTGTTPGATRFITGAISTGEQTRVAEPMATGEESALAAESTTIPAQRPDLSTETGRQLGDTLNPTVRAASARVHSAATIMAARPEAFRHAEAPALVAGQRVVAAEQRMAVAGVGNRVS